MGTFQPRSHFVLNPAFGALKVKHWHCHQRETRVCSFWQGVYSLGDPYMFSCRLWPSMLRFYCVFSLGLYFASMCVEHLSSGETFSGYVPVQKFYNLVTIMHYAWSCDHPDCDQIHSESDLIAFFWGYLTDQLPVFIYSKVERTQTAVLLLAS